MDAVYFLGKFFLIGESAGNRSECAERGVEEELAFILECLEESFEVLGGEE